jgi:signal transduction histidine kinase
VRERPTLAADLGAPELRSVLAVPLWVGETRRGVLWTGSVRPGAFAPEDQTFLTLVAARVGLRLGTAELTRRRAEVERTEVEQQAKQDFLSVVSHELKTPVAVIKAYTEVLEGRAQRTGASDADREVLTRIGEQADRMLGLVEQFLDLQRIEAGLMPLEQSRFDMAELARRLVQATQVTTSAHKLLVEAPRPVYVRADRRRVEQVLQNLLDNAIKYSPEGGPVVVRVQAAPAPDAAAPAISAQEQLDAPAQPATGRAQDDPDVAADGATPDAAGAGAAAPTAGTALVSVTDRGIGLDAEAARRAFDRFYQAGNVPVRGHVGLGLGLYISREIVTRHGGQMWVESRPGRGSSFYFTLPLARRDSAED